MSQSELYKHRKLTWYVWNRNPQRWLSQLAIQP